MTPTTDEDEWDEDAARAEWERRRAAHSKENPDYDLTTTWEDVRGFWRGFSIGERWEREVADFLRSEGLTTIKKWDGDIDEWKQSAENVLGYVIAPPDLGGIDEWTLELKNHKSAQYSSLGKFMDQMEDEKQITHDRFGAVIAKRRGRPIEDAYVVMPLGDWVRILLERSDKS